MSIKEVLSRMFCPKEKEVITKHHFIKSSGVENIAFLSKVTRNVIRADMTELISKVCDKEDIERELIRSICIQESELIPTAIRVEPQLREVKWYQRTCLQYQRDPEKIINTASVGIMQILFVNCLKWVHKSDTPYSICGNPKQGLLCGVWHFKGLLDEFGEIEKAVSAYKAGHPTSTNYESYVKPIMERYKNAK